MSNNLYKKIEIIEATTPNFGEELTEDQKKIVETALEVLQKEIAEQRRELSYKLKLNPMNDEHKRKIDAISYNTLNIRHLKIKLGII